ncbi:MAG: HlyD family efflux transporter periplasmic adaptor subunit [Saprospiraceae bacterium]|nr:HlyD family efflux transporter periplasmic adaptor subunit [Saprospiraceae bacterium]
MDRKLEKKFWTTRRILTIVGIIAVIGLAYAAYVSTSGKPRLNVQAERITVSNVERGIFKETIPVNGVVLPITTIYLDVLEGGRVEEKYVEDGAMMREKDPIIRLSNTDLELDLVNRETAVYDLITNMQNTRNLAEQNTIRLQNQLADVDNALAEAKRIYDLNKGLFEQKVISEQDFRSSKNNYDYQMRRKKLTEQQLHADSVTFAQQIKQMQESINRTQVGLQIMRKKSDDLTVRAPVSGQLTSLSAEYGQSITPGTRIGQIDVLSGFKVQADIDEHYISRIFTGLRGDFTFGGKTYDLEVKKIYSQVTAGRFQVDMEFVGAVPEGIRRGQTLQVRLALSAETTALLLPRGGFYQQTGGNWIFKVDETGNKAYRVDIQLGRQSPDYYEVLGGLQEGDKVVTSSYENYGTMEELVIKGEGGGS